MSLLQPTSKAARLSEDGLYRYTLTRGWADAPGWSGGETDAVVWICLNPSTADHEKDDPTVKRMMGFTQSFGYSTMVVANLFAYRSRNPTALAHADDPIGPDNDEVLAAICEGAPLIIAGWGAHKFAQERAAQVLKMLTSPTLHAAPVTCLGRTKEGHPKHPLYLPWDARLDVLQPEE